METFGHNVVCSAKKKKKCKPYLVRNWKQRGRFCTGYVQKEKRWVTTIQLRVTSKDGCVASQLSASSEEKISYLFFQTGVKVKWQSLSIKRHRLCLWREQRACYDHVQLPVSQVLFTKKSDATLVLATGYSRVLWFGHRSQSGPQPAGFFAEQQHSCLVVLVDD